MDKTEKLQRVAVMMSSLNSMQGHVPQALILEALESLRAIRLAVVAEAGPRNGWEIGSFFGGQRVRCLRRVVRYHKGGEIAEDEACNFLGSVYAVVTPGPYVYVDRDDGTREAIPVEHAHALGVSNG